MRINLDGTIILRINLDGTEEKTLVDYLAEPEKTDYVKSTAESLFLGKSGGVLCPKTETGDYPEFCVTAKMRCKIELIFQGGSGVGCARLVYNITPTKAEVKGHPRPLGSRRRRSAP